MPKSQAQVDLKLLEGRSFIIGRQGHIFVDSITASNHHAEIKVVNQKIYLRDLDSTNGTFLLKSGSRVRFEKGYVKPQQIVVIGGKRHTVMELLSIAGNFGEIDGAKTQIQLEDETDWRE